MERPGRPFPPVPGVGVRDVTGTPSRRPIPAESPQAWRLRDTAWACHSVRGRPYARLTGRRTAGSPHAGLLVPAAAVGSQGLLSLGAGDVPADDLHRELARERPPVEVEPDEDVVELHGGPPARGRAARFPPPGGPPGRDPRRPAPGQGRPDGRSEGRKPLEAAPRRRGIRRPTARTAGPRPGAGARPRRRRRGRSRPARARRPGETIGGWPVTGRPSTGGQTETPAGGRGLGGCGQKGGSSLNCPLLLAALLVRSGRAVAHLRLGPTSSASISTIDRLSPSGVSQARLLRRPLTMTRLPLATDSATFSACWRQTLTRKNEVSPSFQESPSRTRGVTASRKLATACPLGVNRSSGSSVRLPATVTKVSMAPSLGSVCLRAQAAWSGSLAGKGPGQRCGRNRPIRRLAAGSLPAATLEEPRAASS